MDNRITKNALIDIENRLYQTSGDCSDLEVSEGAKYSLSLLRHSLDEAKIYLNEICKIEIENQVNP